MHTPRPGGAGLPRVVARRAVTGGFLVVLLACGCAAPAAEHDWEAVEARIAAEFPGVPHITTVDLANLLADPARDVVLIDARDAGEFAVSHLQGARHATSVDHAEDIVAASPDNATVVAYCSVGYRSAALVAALRERSSRTVHNLRGSIFRWANEDRPVYRAATRVGRVHPYDDAWGALLRPDLHAYDP